MGLQPKAVTCDAAQGLVTEAQKTVQEAAEQGLRDCLIDGALAKVEHYEIASYRGLLTGAQYLGQQQFNAKNITQLLQQNLQQEEQTAQKLEQTAPQLLQKAMQREGATATSRR
jgi:ferritin-like metal-binding protein YciE